MSQQQIYLAQRDNDQRFSSDHELGTETCAVCQRVMVERYTDMWYAYDPKEAHDIPDIRMGHEPIQGPGQRLVCSRRCLSQLVYDTAPEDVKSLMRVMARQLHDWFENVNLKSTDWCLAHSFITHAVSHLDFVVHNDQMDTFAQELLGRDWRDQNYPEWFEEAISPVAPAKPVGQVVTR